MDRPSDPTRKADAPGLRGRQKAQRRKEILRCAEQLFARDGIDAATVAAIAEKAGVSPPTVFNYFGTKENILSALIFEGTEQERTRHLRAPRKTDCEFSVVLGSLLCECTENTMRIAGKRVWRYAEAANIRRPGTEFEQQFSFSDAELLNLVVAFLSDYDIVLRNGKSPDLRFLGVLFFDRWTARYLEYIKDDPMPMEDHFTILRDDVETMVSLLFDDRFAAKSPFKNQEAAQ